MHCRFELFRDGGGFSVRLSLDDGTEKVAPFRFDLTPTARVGRVIAKIDRGECQLDDLQDAGSELWSALCSTELVPVFRQARESSDGILGLSVDVTIMRELDALPWEAMYDVIGGRFLCSDPD